MKSKKRITYLRITLLLALILVSGMAQAATNQSGTVPDLTPEEQAWLEAHPKITLATSINNPRSYRSPDGMLQGMDVDYVRLLEQKLGIQFEYIVSNWSTALDRAMKHEVDAILNVAKVKNREPYLNFTEIYSTTPQAVVALENEPVISDLNDFCGRKIAVHRASSRVTFLKENYPCIEVVEMENRKDILSAVITCKVDAGFDNYYSIVNCQKEMLLPNLKIIYFKYLPPVGFVRIGVRNDQPLLVSILNKAILSISEEEKNYIITKWLGIELPPLSGATEQQAANADLTESEKSWLNTHPEIRYAYNPQWAPIEYQDKAGQHQGISAFYLARLEQDLGIRFKGVPVRTLEEVKLLRAQDKLDIMPTLTETTQRKKHYSFTKPYLSIPAAIFSTDDVAYLGRIDSLKGKRIAVVGDYTLHEWLKEKHPQLDLTPVKDTKEGLRLLSRGKVFAFAGGLLPTSYYIAEQGLSQVKVMSEIPYRYQLSMAVRKDLPILGKIIDKALRNISQQERDAIYNDWVSIHYSRHVDYTLIWQLLAAGVVLLAVILFWNRKMAREIAERKQVEDQLRKLSRAVEQSHNTIVITDLDAKIEFVNPAFTRATGYTFEEAYLENPSVLKSEEHDDVFYQAMWDTLTSGEVWQGELYNKRKDGSCYWEFATISPVKDEKGKTTHYVAVKEDISKRKEIEIELIQSREQAEAANRAKSEFLANMSHEIRTPMNAIIGMSRLALNTELNYRQHNFITKVHQSAESLLRILNDILDFSKIEADKLELEIVDFPLHGVVDSLVNLIGYKTDEQGLTLNVEIDPDVPSILRGDPLRLGQILINLANNAAKFTRQGGITVKVDLDKRKDDLLHLYFRVCDTGIGISEEQQRQLFQPFNQGDSSTSRCYGGTGLGLTICARLCALMGGEIWVESEPGKGACFQFTVQLQEGDASRVIQQTIDTDEAVARLRGANILLVEDNELNRELAVELLIDIGIRVTVACNGQEALELLQEERFDGVLMDVQMPVMDGYTATRRIREQEQFKELPVIAMTANVMAGDLEEAEVAGMNDHIGKPLDVNQMFNTMARWIVPALPTDIWRKEEAQLLPEQKSVSFSFDVLNGIDIERGLQISRDKPDLYHRLLTRFSDSERDFADRFCVARQDNDSEAMIRIAHTLKGTAGTIGAKGIEQMADELETACIHSETDTVEGLAQQIDEELAPVIQGIDRSIILNQQPAPLADVELIPDLFARLKTLLSQDDPNAMQTMEALEQLLPQQDIKELKGAVAEFDFEAALYHLAQLETKYE